MMVLAGALLSWGAITLLGEVVGTGWAQVVVGGVWAGMAAVVHWKTQKEIGDVLQEITIPS